MSRGLVVAAAAIGGVSFVTGAVLYWIGSSKVAHIEWVANHGTSQGSPNVIVSGIAQPITPWTYFVSVGFVIAMAGLAVLILAVVVGRVTGSRAVATR